MAISILSPILVLSAFSYLAPPPEQPFPTGDPWMESEQPKQPQSDGEGDEASPDNGEPLVQEDPLTATPGPAGGDGSAADLQPIVEPARRGKNPVGGGGATAALNVAPAKLTLSRRARSRTDIMDEKWPSQAEVPLKFRLDVDIGRSGTFAADQTFLAVADGRSFSGLSTGVRFDVPVGGQRVFVGLRVGYHPVASTATDIYSGLAYTRLSLREVHIAPRVSVRIFEGVDAVFSVMGGPSFGYASFAQNDIPPSTEQGGARSRVLTGLVGGTGGLALYLPRKFLPRRGRSHMSMGLEVDLGYVHRFAFQFSPETKRGDELDIEYGGPDIGRVPPAGGLHGHAGVFVRFM